MNDHILEVRDDRGCFREIVFFHYLTSPLGGLYKKNLEMMCTAKWIEYKLVHMGKRHFCVLKPEDCKHNQLHLIHTNYQSIVKLDIAPLANPSPETLTTKHNKQLIWLGLKRIINIFQVVNDEIKQCIISVCTHFYFIHFGVQYLCGRDYPQPHKLNSTVPGY